MNKLCKIFSFNFLLYLLTFSHQNWNQLLN